MSTAHAAADSRPEVRTSLDRLQCLQRASAESSLAAMRLANLRAIEAAVVLTLALDLAASLPEELGPHAADAVDQAAAMGDLESAAVMVAEAFLALLTDLFRFDCGPLGGCTPSG